MGGGGGGGPTGVDLFDTPIHYIDEGIGELTGRNKRRAAEADAAKVQKAEASAAAARARQLAILQQNDINASNAAAAALPSTIRVPGEDGSSADPRQPLGTIRDYLGGR